MGKDKLRSGSFIYGKHKVDWRIAKVRSGKHMLQMREKKESWSNVNYVTPGVPYANIRNQHLVWFLYRVRT